MGKKQMKMEDMEDLKLPEKASRASSAPAKIVRDPAAQSSEQRTEIGELNLRP